mgnify:FL=1
MAFEAKLYIGEQVFTHEEFELKKNVYDLVECEYEFFQTLDESGKPASRPQGGIIKFVMSAQGDDDMLFYEWMFNRAAKHRGTIEFCLSTDKNKEKYLHLFFDEAYLVNFYQYFHNANSMLMRSKVTLSAKKIVFGSGATFVNDWRLPM